MFLCLGLTVILMTATGKFQEWPAGQDSWLLQTYCLGWKTHGISAQKFIFRLCLVVSVLVCEVSPVSDPVLEISKSQYISCWQDDIFRSPSRNILVVLVCAVLIWIVDACLCFSWLQVRVHHWKNVTPETWCLVTERVICSKLKWGWWCRSCPLSKVFRYKQWKYLKKYF